MAAATLGIQTQAMAETSAQSTARTSEAPTKILEIQLTGQAMISFAEVKSHLMKLNQNKASQNLSIVQGKMGLSSYLQHDDQTIRLKINSGCYVFDGCSLKIAARQGQSEVSAKIAFERMKDEAQQSNSVRERILKLSESLINILMAQKN